LAEYRGAVQILLVCVFTAMLGLGIISPILPIYAQSLGATLTQVGLLSSAWSISRFVFASPIGRFSDRRGRKRIIAVGLLVYAVVSFLYSIAWDFTSLVTIRLLHGLGSAMTMPVAMAYVAELSPVGQEGRYMGSINLAMFGGMGLGPLIGGYFSDAFTLSVPFYLMGGITATSLALTVFLLPDDRQRKIKATTVRPSFRKVLSNRLLRASFVYRTVAALGRGSIMGFLSIYMGLPVEDGGLGFSLSATGFIISAGQIGSALLQNPFGVLADKYDKIRLILLSGGHRRHRGEGDRSGNHDERSRQRHEPRDGGRPPHFWRSGGPTRTEAGLLRREHDNPRRRGILLRPAEDRLAGARIKGAHTEGMHMDKWVPGKQFENDYTVDELEKIYGDITSAVAVPVNVVIKAEHRVLDMSRME